MKRFFASCALVLTSVSLMCCLADARSVSSIKTFKIKGDLVSRTFELCGTQLVDKGITDLSTGVSYMSARKYHVEDVTLEHIAVPGDTLRPGYDKWVLSMRDGGLLVRKEYRLYPGVKAMACDNYFSLTEECAAALENEGGSDGAAKILPGNWVMERVELPSRHYLLRSVEFWDATDNHDNLVREVEAFPFYKNNLRGNLLFAAPVPQACDEKSGTGVSGGGVALCGGIWMLKEAPTSRSQLAYPGRDFSTDAAAVHMVGVGVTRSDLKAGEWTKGYSSVVGLYDGTELSALTGLRQYQKMLRKHISARDDMVMMNTWGDRSQDAKVTEQFCIQEIRKAQRLGISHFQIDDGWQSGKSPNSATKGGSFKNIWDNPDYWTPDPVKYPNGLGPVVEVARECGVTLGLWYNPSIKNNFANWKDDADAIIGLWRKYGINVFKIDGVELPCKEAERNFRRILDTVLEATDGDVVFNLDVTAGRRGGYFMFNEYGNLFLENRYTDWGNYYPYRSLRNMWMLSRYVPAENIQLEFLNKWRNEDKYDPAVDSLAPARYDFEYLFALTMAGEPLAWMEASNLPEEGFDIAPLVKKYRTVAPDFHRGIILPVGDEPNGYSWTGFQSMLSDKEGYLLVFRELNPEGEACVKTWLPAGAKVKLEYVLGSSVTSGKGSASVSGGSGKGSFTGKSLFDGKPIVVDGEGRVRLALPSTNTFVLLRYTL